MLVPLVENKDEEDEEEDVCTSIVVEAPSGKSYVAQQPVTEGIAQATAVLLVVYRKPEKYIVFGLSAKDQRGRKEGRGGDALGSLVMVTVCFPKPKPASVQLPE